MDRMNEITTTTIATGIVAALESDLMAAQKSEEVVAAVADFAA